MITGRLKDSRAVVQIQRVGNDVTSSPQDSCVAGGIDHYHSSIFSGLSALHLRERWFVRYMGMMAMIHVPVGLAPLASTTFYKNAAFFCFHNFLTLTRPLCWSDQTLQRRKRSKMSCRWAAGLTGVAVSQHECLEDIWKRDDSLHHLLLVHHHQPVHLKEKQETLRMRFSLELSYQTPLGLRNTLATTLFS